MRKFWIGMTLCLVIGQGTLVAQDWESQTSGTTNPLNGAWLIDSLRGVVVGDGGTVLETEDGGLTWQPLALTVDDMLDVAFRDQDIGLIVGDNGSIFRTTNGGQDWVAIAAVTQNNLSGVAFGTPGLALAAGRDGTILRSTDDGASWTLVETGADRYRSIAAVGLRAWIVGNDGAMRFSEDGGQSWFSPPSVTTSDLHDVVFVSADEGWVVGQNNTVLYTDDGGAGWTARSGSIGIGLNTVFFGNPELGWTGGSLGNVFHSTDGALVWAGEATPTTSDLDAMHFADAFHGLAVGLDGTILTRVVPSVNLSVAPDAVEWDALAAEVTYDVVRGDLGTLRSTGGDFQTATEECLGFDLTGTSVGYSVTPGSGAGSWFLVRANVGVQGTYDSGSFLQTGLRDGEIGLSGADCP